MIRSFYWNTIDQEMAYEVIEGKIAMDLIKPVSIQWMWICRAMGESAFRLGLLTLPTAIVVALVFPVQGPASLENFALFLVGALGSFFLMAAINFMIGTCAIPLKSILALIRAKYWLIEMLSGLLIPISFFPGSGAENHGAGCPSSTSPYMPLQIYLGKLGRARGSARARNTMALGNRDARAGAFLVGTGVTEDHHSWRVSDEFVRQSATPMREESRRRAACGGYEPACAAFRGLFHAIREGADRVSRRLHRQPV